MAREQGTTRPGDERRRASSLLGAYSGTFPACRRLTKEDEAELTRRAAANDTEAVEILIEANFPLLVRTAMAFQGRGLALEDLIGEATIGMLEAVGRFDPERGFRFMTYAVWWVRRALVRALSTQARNVRIPRNRARQADGKEVVPFPREISLSASSEGEEGHGLEDVLDAELPLADEEVLRSEEHDALHAALAELPERQLFVVSERYGLGTDERRTLRSVASDLGVTKERVRQIEGKALGRLEERLQPVMQPAI